MKRTEEKKSEAKIGTITILMRIRVREREKIQERNEEQDHLQGLNLYELEFRVQGLGSTWAPDGDLIFARANSLS